MKIVPSNLVHGLVKYLEVIMVDLYDSQTLLYFQNIFF